MKSIPSIPISRIMLFAALAIPIQPVAALRSAWLTP